MVWALWCAANKENKEGFIMLYVLLVTVILNGHPDTLAAGVYRDKPSCQKALSAYKREAAARGFRVINAKCNGME